MISGADIFNANILIVDDREANVSLLDQILSEDGYTRITTTTNSLEVCALHEKNRYDLIVLDLQMPDMDGFQVMEGLKKYGFEHYLPVIVLTAQPAHRLRALRAGARDFIGKPFELADVTTRIHNMLEVRLLYKELENHNKVLEHRTLYEATTGLASRDLFDDRLAHAIALAKAHAWRPVVLCLDLDRIRHINDSHGRAVADRVSNEVAKRLLKNACDVDTVCGNGGTEFLYLLMNPQGNQAIEQVARALLAAIAQPIDMEELQFVIGASIGIAVYPADGSTAEQLTRSAAAAARRSNVDTSSLVFFQAQETEQT
jgi:two-component system cell cycle response regulator